MSLTGCTPVLRTSLDVQWQLCPEWNTQVWTSLPDPSQTQPHQRITWSAKWSIPRHRSQTFLWRGLPEIWPEPSLIFISNGMGDAGGPHCEPVLDGHDSGTRAWLSRCVFCVC